MNTLQRMKDYVEGKVLRNWVWLKSERGQGLIEYALIAVLIAVAAMVALTALQTDISTKLNNIGDKINP